MTTALRDHLLSPRYARIGDPCWEDDPRTAALRSELAQYRELPLVPAQEHQRVCEQRDHALRQLDSTTAEIARLRDRRSDTEAELLRALVLTLSASLADMIREREQMGGYSTPEQQATLRVARARLAEVGRVIG